MKSIMLFLVMIFILALSSCSKGYGCFYSASFIDQEEVKIEHQTHEEKCVDEFELTTD